VKLRRRRLIQLSTLAILASVLGIGCGAGGTASSPQSSTGPLRVSEAKRLFRELPYSIQFEPVRPPDGADGAFAGRAVGSHGTIVHFGVSLGDRPAAVPLPGAGTASAFGDSRDGFVYNDDLQVPGPGHTWIRSARFRTAAQWSEATTMSVKMMEKLCRAASGKPCPI
jgi:hypothetical protein